MVPFRPQATAIEVNLLVRLLWQNIYFYLQSRSIYTKLSLRSQFLANLQSRYSIVSFLGIYAFHLPDM